jgi:hypothetical protein
MLRSLHTWSTADEMVKDIKYRKIADLVLRDAEPESLLDEIFQKMNIATGNELPALLGERSMSVGDIVVIDDENIYLCAPNGWNVLLEFEKEEVEA